MNTLINLLSLALLACSLSSCANAQSSDRPTAERVFTTEVGYVCFIVRDEQGKGVGGNCVKD